MSIFEVLQKAMRSPGFKFVLVAFLVLILSIPLLFVYLMTSERESYANKALRDVSHMWGSAQTVRGPFIIVPTLKKREVRRGNETRVEKVRNFAVFLPENLDVAADVKSEIRSRGIFEVPVYRSKLRFSGRFKTADLTRINRSVDEILWPEAVFTLIMNDVRAIKKTAEITIDGANKQLFRSGSGISHVKGIHVPVNEAQAQGDMSFAFTLHLNGSTSLNFVPAGGETAIKMTSDWPHPSFKGAFLPDKRQINDKGFQAQWAIPRLARGQAQAFLAENLSALMRDTIFGVTFYQPVGYYGLVERSLKYALGFIAIAFFAVFIMEIHSGRRVHWIQYVFVGLALIIFYLVLLGTSEHLGFEFSYTIAALSTCVLIAAYVASALKSVNRGFALFSIMGLIYGLLYLLLKVEDYAMLIGSIAAFLLLAIVMFATRNVDWSGSGTGTTGKN